MMYYNNKYDINFIFISGLSWNLWLSEYTKGIKKWRMPSSGMLRRVALVRTDVSKETETPVLTRATWHNIPEDGILHSHRHENLKSYRIKKCLYYSASIRTLLYMVTQWMRKLCLPYATLISVQQCQLTACNLSGNRRQWMKPDISAW
jgi:hypothetical protein